MAGPEGSTNGQMGWVSFAEQDGPAGGQATRHFPQGPRPCTGSGWALLAGLISWTRTEAHTGRAQGLRDAQVCMEQMGGPQNPFRDPRPGPGHTEELGSGRCPWSWKDEAATATSTPSEDMGVGGPWGYSGFLIFVLEETERPPSGCWRGT